MIRRGLAVLVLATTTGACGDIPQPFRHDGMPASLARPKLTRGVTVRPPEDAPNGTALAEALVRALEEQEVPALVHAGPAFGHVIESSSQDHGKTVGVRWLLKGPDGSETVSAVQTIPKTVLDKPEPALLKRLATESAAQLARPLADPDAQPAARAVAAQPEPRIGVAILPLRGLPGDGDKALSAAIRRALDRGRLLVKDEGADYMVEGKVTVAPGLPGEDTVTVAWIIKRAKDGKELGNIGQDGAVPRGRLAGPWGTLARDIAEGGAAGVLEVIRADKGTK